MSKNKYLYEFKVPREIEVDEIETVSGGTLTKKVKKLTEVDFAILSPNRRLIDDAELFFGVKLAEAIKAGLMPKALLAKRFANDDGVLSEVEVKEMNSLRSRLYELSNLATRLSIKNPNDLSPAEKVALDGAINEIGEIQNKLQNFELIQASLYENTAEVRARNKTIFWYVLQLSLIKNDRGDYVPLFGGKSFEEKLVSYDSIEEKQEDYLRLAIERFSYFITFFYYGKVNTPEEFALLEKTMLGTRIEASPVEEKQEEVVETEVLPDTIPVSELPTE